MLAPRLAPLGFSASQIDAMVKHTGPRTRDDAGFTFSDLTQRLLPAIVLAAYPASAVDPMRALAMTEAMAPTPPFRDAAA